MWSELERTPALAAPGSGDRYALEKLTNGRNRTLSQEDANDLCERYRPLALKIAGQYANRGIELNELRAAGLLGLIRASHGYFPDLGAFGPYARKWIWGEITLLFKPTADAMSSGRVDPLNAPAFDNEENDGTTKLDLIIDESPPPISIDVTALNDRERCIFKGQIEGKTNAEIGKDLGISRERVRQISDRIGEKVERTKGNIAHACIRDLLKRRGYRKPFWDAKSLELRRFATKKYECCAYTAGEISALVDSIELSADDNATWRQRWGERRRNSETDFGRKAAGPEKRFKVEGSISWKQLTIDEVERAKQKTPDDHLENFFLTHHQLERFRFDMRVKRCGGTKVIRPRKGTGWCWASDPKPDPEAGTIHVKRRKGGPCGGAIYYKPALFGPSKKASCCTKDGRRIVYRTFPLEVRP